MERLNAEENCDQEFFEIILTRTDDHEFVGVARFCSARGTSTAVESGDRLADVCRRLMEGAPAKRMPH